MKFSSVSHLERLQAWLSQGSVSLGGSSLENVWLSPLLPSKRFGVDAWVGFHMHLVRNAADVGPFKAWIVLHASQLRLVGLFERPLADKFGVVDAFPRSRFNVSELVSNSQLLVLLNAAALRFFADVSPSPEDASLVVLLQDCWSVELFDRMHDVVAPDFFVWLAQDASKVTGSL